MKERGYFWGLDSFWWIGLPKRITQPKRQTPVLKLVGSKTSRPLNSNGHV